MAIQRNRNNIDINAREANRANVAEIYMPAMPPFGLQRIVGRWLRQRRRRNGRGDLGRLNSYLLADIGVPTRQRQQLSERQLTAFYEQPLGRARNSYLRGEPAEQHALRQRREASARH